MTNTSRPEVTQKVFDFISLKLSEVRGGGRWRGVLRMNKLNGAAFFAPKHSEYRRHSIVIKPDTLVSI